MAAPIIERIAAAEQELERRRTAHEAAKAASITALERRMIASQEREAAAAVLRRLRAEQDAMDQATDFPGLTVAIEQAREAFSQAETARKAAERDYAEASRLAQSGAVTYIDSRTGATRSVISDERLQRLQWASDTLQQTVRDTTDAASEASNHLDRLVDQRASAWRAAKADEQAARDAVAEQEARQARDRGIAASIRRSVDNARNALRAA